MCRALLLVVLLAACSATPPEVSPPEVAPPEVNPPEAAPPEVAPPEVAPPEAAPPEVPPPEPEDLVAAGIIAVQTVQDAYNSVPLIEAKETLLIADEPATTWRGDEHTTANPLPPEWATGSVTVTAGGESEVLHFQPVPPLRLRLLPMRHDGVEPRITPEVLTELERRVLEQLPFNTVTLEVLPVIDVAGTGRPLRVRTLTLAREALQHGSITIGLLPSIPDQEFVGWASIGNPWAVAMLHNERGRVRTTTFLHEIVHTSGMRHAPCGNPLNIDERWPDSTAEVTDYMYSNIEKQQLHDRYDLMSYCNPRWPSAHTYTQTLSGHSTHWR